MRTLKPIFRLVVLAASVSGCTVDLIDRPVVETRGFDRGAPVDGFMAILEGGSDGSVSDALPDGMHIDASALDAAAVDAAVDAAADRRDARLFVDAGHALDLGEVDAQFDAISDASPVLDRDGDGVLDADDAFPDDPTEWLDTDADGQGDNADMDDDADGLLDAEERVFGADCAFSNPLRADTDRDGRPDATDPYPRDPFPPFIARPSLHGQIEVFVSNEDGSFHPPVLVGAPLRVGARTLAYARLSVADFDGDGRLDILAQSSTRVLGESDRNVYLFSRGDGADRFNQRLLGIDSEMPSVVADFDGDGRIDLAVVKFDRPNVIVSGHLFVYRNNGQPEADCVVGDTPEAGCFFVRTVSTDISAAVAQRWTASTATQASDVDGDGVLDILFATQDRGGNDVTRVFSLSGQGDGTFAPPVPRLVHNQNAEYAPATGLLAGDFDADGTDDICLGFDDDGLAGNAWTYWGVGRGRFAAPPVAAVDINPGNVAEQGGAESLGRSGSGKVFDADLDGQLDLIIGVHHEAYDRDGQIRLYRGRGDGTFDPDFTIIGAQSPYMYAFALPSRRCPGRAPAQQ